MTTIAWDGRVLASDSQEELNGWATYNVRKIHQVRPDVYVGLSGADSLTDHYIKTLNKCWTEEIEAIPALTLEGRPLDESSNIQALLIDARRRMSPLCYRLFLGGLQPVSSPQALGSGALMAYPALLLGHSALEAVAFAIVHDPYSGGEVQYVDVTSGASYYAPHPHGKIIK